MNKDIEKVIDTKAEKFQSIVAKAIGGEFWESANVYRDSAACDEVSLTVVYKFAPGDFNRFVGDDENIDPEDEFRLTCEELIPRIKKVVEKEWKFEIQPEPVIDTDETDKKIVVFVPTFSTEEYVRLVLGDDIIAIQEVIDAYNKGLKLRDIALNSFIR